MTTETTVSKNETLARRIFWLAYEASIPMGLGVLHYTDKETEDTVWKHASKRDGFVSGDYIFGRMMKIGITWDNEKLNVTPSRLSPDYQSWCARYPTVGALVTAAEKSLA